MLQVPRAAGGGQESLRSMGDPSANDYIRGDGQKRTGRSAMPVTQPLGRSDLLVPRLGVASTGVIYKAYENGLHFPTDATGAIEGQRVCRYWTAVQSSTGPMCRRRTRSTPTPHRVRTGAPLWSTGLRRDCSR